MVDTCGHLMVCLCDLTEAEWIEAGLLGSLQLCENHNAAKLQSLTIPCILHVKNADGEIVPLRSEA